MSEELDDLKKQVADLQTQVNPPPRQPSTQGPTDYTAGMSMPRSAMQAMVNAVDMASLRADARKRNPIDAASSPHGPNPQPTPQRQSGTRGWINERPIEPPPGIAHVDRLMDTQDRIDLAERALALAKAGIVKKRDGGG
jgi:hypothetical protein